MSVDEFSMRRLRGSTRNPNPADRNISWALERLNVRLKGCFANILPGSSERHSANNLGERLSIPGAGGPVRQPVTGQERKFEAFDDGRHPPKTKLRTCDLVRPNLRDFFVSILGPSGEPWGEDATIRGLVGWARERGLDNVPPEDINNDNMFDEVLLEAREKLWLGLWAHLRTTSWLLPHIQIGLNTVPMSVYTHLESDRQVNYAPFLSAPVRSVIRSIIRARVQPGR
ncbi:hypothetical protein B0T26DRAFT_679627 [Lasiosphaeria miniovina]|uniref:Uncharacterized protein n=1 Tax=Lasiosphaeria miniovina TaxID=1954250 RepID=A0AA40A6T1_9PEZI|nr:uncharacterized protein B0T26DRAFT_679627 [Lasiosphaeria miniovina]KAK0710339.1 hypothetical protein B0T26DRAFT_679627 [Lasiosphaeria miniovina]